MKSRIEFVQTRVFSRQREGLLGDDDEFSRLQTALANEPEAGAVMAGTGGLRKLRWQRSDLPQGKRGGLRIVYLYVPEAETIGLLLVYRKSEMSILTSDEKRSLSAVASDIRAALQLKRRV